MYIECIKKVRLRILGCEVMTIETTTNICLINYFSEKSIRLVPGLMSTGTRQYFLPYRWWKKNGFSWREGSGIDYTFHQQKQFRKKVLC